MSQDWLDVSATAPRIAYTATAGQTLFTVPFIFFENADLLVYQNEVLLTLGTNYTVTGAENENGGTVTLLVAATLGDAIAIVRDVAIVQTTHFPPSGPFDIAAANIQNSKLIAIDQQLADRIQRSVHLATSDPTADMEVPDVAARASKMWAWDSLGSLVPTTHTAQEFDSVLTGALSVAGGFGKVNIIGTLAGLKALTPVAGAVVYVQGYAADSDGGQGIFIWNALSTATPNDALVVQQNAGGVGRWLRASDLRTFNLGWLGAGNGSQAVDDAALAAAITYANSASGKVAIVWPNSTFTHGACAVTLIKADVSFSGSGATTINLVLTAGQTFLKFGSKTTGTANNVIVSNILFNCAGSAFPSTMFALENTFHVRFYDLNLSLAQTFLVVGTVGDSATGVNGVKLSNIFGSSANAGAPLVRLNYGAGLFVDDCYLYVGISAPTHGGAAQATAVGTHVFSMVSANWDTASINNCVFQFFDIGFQVVVRGAGVVENFHITNSYIANCKHEAILFDVTAGGVAQGFCVSNSWLESWEADTVKFGNVGGFMDDNCFDSNTFNNAGFSHANITGLSKSNKLINNRMICCNQMNVGSPSINMAGGATGWTISGNTGNYDDSGSTGTWRGPIGIFVGVDCDDYIISNNRMLGSTNSYVISTNTVNSKQRRVVNNANADFTTYGGYARIVATALVANTYVNKTPFVLTSFVFGGTSVTDLALNGTATGLTSGTIQMEPGDTLTSSYVAAPTVNAKIHA